MLTRSAPMKRTALRRSSGEASASAPAMRPKKCRAPGCNVRFTPTRSFVRWCSVECATVIGLALHMKRNKAQQAEQKRAEREKTRARKDALLTQPDWVKLAQREFNTYIRLRDAGKPCICCGRTPAQGFLTGGEWDAGHYRSRGAAPELRFNEDNCHAQLKTCNRRAWDVASYRANLIGRIGLQAVEALEGPHPPQKWSIADLRAIRDTYRAKARDLKKGTP